MPKASHSSPMLPGHVKAKLFPSSEYTRAIDKARLEMGGKIVPGVKLPGLSSWTFCYLCDECSFLVKCPKHNIPELKLHDSRV